MLLLLLYDDDDDCFSDTDDVDDVPLLMGVFQNYCTLDVTFDLDMSTYVLLPGDASDLDALD